jgi:ABC-type ATPase with predicted acetyltransferase domain
MNADAAITTTREPTPRVHEAGARLGLVVRRVPEPTRTLTDCTSERLERMLTLERPRPSPECRAGSMNGTHAARENSSGAVILITGPSGAGKSTLLNQLERSLKNRAVRVARTDRVACDTHADGQLDDRPLIDLFAGTIDRAMYWLSRVGLAEAHLIARHPDQLSDGQRWRLRLGLTLAGLPRNGWALADEFGAILDRPTALAVARSTAACARATGRVLVACTAREDLSLALTPDQTETLSLAAHAEDHRP